MKLYIFSRGDVWYDIQLKDDTDARANAISNPGTTKVTDYVGRLVWEDKGRKYDREFVKFDDDVFVTVQEWFTDCIENGFSNGNGNGYWVKKGYMNHDDEVFSSQPEDATHVIWYNK